MPGSWIHYETREEIGVVRLCSEDGTNRLTRECLCTLTSTLRNLSRSPKPLAITGNQKFFSAGADLAEIAALAGSSAYEFSKLGQELMQAVADFPAPVYAAITGYCMGGGLDLALACRCRIAAPHAIFGHRGAVLGLITGWGGTQRLPRLIGKARALEMLVAAEKVNSAHALKIGLVDAISNDPLTEAVHRIRLQQAPNAASRG
jgi:enoyl-CoA hydratase